MSRIDVLNWDRLDALESRMILLEIEVKVLKTQVEKQAAEAWKRDAAIDAAVMRREREAGGDE